MSACSVLFLVLLVSVPECRGQLLELFNATTGNKRSYVREWASYTERFIQKLLLEKEGREYLEVLRDLRVHSEVDNMKRNWLARLVFGSETLSHLLFTLSAHTPSLVLSSGSHVFLPVTCYEWSLFAADSLRAILTFIELKIHSHYKLCDTKVLIRHFLYQRKSSRLFFTSCGIHDQFKIYAALSSVIGQICYKRGDDFSMTVFFNLFSPNLMFTERYTWLGLLRPKTQQEHHVISYDSTQYSSYGFLVGLPLQVLITYERNNSTMAIVFDGPGYRSPKHQLTNTKGHFSCATFQCVLVLKAFTSKTLGQVNFIPAVKKWVLPTTEVIPTRSSSNPYVWRPDVAPGNPGAVSEQKHFATSNGSHVAVSLKSVTFTGESHGDCLLGGIALFSLITMIDSKFIRDEGTICKKSPRHFDHLKTLYSSGSDLFLLFFMYPQYATLSFSLKIYSTFCQVIKVELCNFTEADDLMLLDNQPSLGEFLQMAKTQPKQFKSLSINSEDYPCTVVQIFAKPEKQCTNLLQESTTKPYFETYNFSFIPTMNMVPSSKHQYEYRLQGVLSSVGNLLFEKSLTQEDSFLEVSGKDFFLSRDSDTGLMQCEIRNREDSDKPVFWNSSFTRPQFDEFQKSTFHYLLEPASKTSLFYSLKLNTVGLKGSVNFKVLLWGAFSWMDILLTVYKRHASGLASKIAGNTGVLSAPHSHKALSVTVNKTSLWNQSVVLLLKADLEASMFWQSLVLQA